jgi:hypothetical protein
MCVQTMHIQVMAPKVETRLTNQPKTRKRVECLSTIGESRKILTSLTVGRDIEVDEEAEGGTEDEGGVGDTQAVDPLEDGWSFTFNGKTVESTRADVQVGVGSAQDEDEDSTVDNVVEDFDTDQSGGNDEGGGSGSSPLGVCDEEGGVGSRDDETNDENTADIEDQDTPEGSPDGDRDVLPGILSLADGDTDELGSHVCEESVDESSPEPKEYSQTVLIGNLGFEVFTHGTIGRIPVTKTTRKEKGEFRSEFGKRIEMITFYRV